nr:PLP-dependent transferase [Brachybacterium sp. Z12]
MSDHSQPALGVTFADEYAHGGSGLLAYARAKHVTDFGATLPAASAQQILVGIETLDLRMRKVSADAATLAGRLHGLPDVARVEHPNIPGRPDAHLADRDFPDGTAGVFSFELDGERPRPRRSAMRCGYGPSR